MISYYYYLLTDPESNWPTQEKYHIKCCNLSPHSCPTSDAILWLLELKSGSPLFSLMWHKKLFLIMPTIGMPPRLVSYYNISLQEEHKIDKDMAAKWDFYVDLSWNFHLKVMSRKGTTKKIWIKNKYHSSLITFFLSLS